MTILDALSGSKLVEFGRCLNLVWIWFAKEDRIYCLHSQCLLRVFHKETMIASSNDVFVCKDESNEEWDWSESPGESLFDDEVRNAVLPCLPLCVTGVEQSKWNDLTILLENGYWIEIRIISLSKGESWRLSV